MSELRALLYEPWCPYIDDAVDFAGAAAEAQGETRRDPLATRLPECVPAGLEWEERWWIEHEVNCGNDPPPKFEHAPITDVQAELLFIGQAVKVLGPRGLVTQFARMASEGFAESDIPAALAAALHRLADEKGA